MADADKKCLRCGKCCHVIEDGRVKKCRFLIQLRSGKTLCRKYNTRLGTVIGGDKAWGIKVCGQRVKGEWDYDGCPFNTGKLKFPEDAKKVYNNKLVQINNKKNDVTVLLK